MMTKLGMKVLSVAVAMVVMICLGPVYGKNALKSVSEGHPLPGFTMGLSADPGTRAYLGIESGDQFTVNDIPSKLIMIELFSVLCKTCHQNAPQVNKLYQIIASDPELSASVKMVGIALGNDDKMADGYKKTFNVKFPIVPDPKSEIDRAFPDVSTPCLILTDDKGTVLFAHEGLIDDPDEILAMIRRFYSE